MAKFSTARNVNPATAERKDKFGPGRPLYQAVRGALIARGTHLKGWCRENGVSESTARAALLGFVESPAAAALRARLIRAAGLDTEQAA